MQSKSRVFQQTASRPRHGSSQLARFNELPDEALTTYFVAESMFGKGRSSIDAMRKAGLLEVVMDGRNVRIKVGSIRRVLAAR